MVSVLGLEVMLMHCPGTTATDTVIECVEVIVP